MTEIGNPRGRIALFLDEQDAIDLANCFAHDDTGRHELLEAVKRTYPKDEAGPVRESDGD